MAYRTDKTFDSFKRNTQYINFGGILCCTCRICVEKGSLPTVTFKNFRPRPTLHPELPPNSGGVNNPVLSKSYSPYMEFVQDYIPNGEFTYILDFDNYWYESWQSPDIQSSLKYATSLKYYPFRECTGVPTSTIPAQNIFEYTWALFTTYSGNPGVYDIENKGMFFPNIAPYGCLINTGWIYVFPAPTFWPWWYLENEIDFSGQYSKALSFSNCNTNVIYDESIPPYFTRVFNPSYAVGAEVSPWPACTDSQLQNAGYLTEPDQTPTNPIDSGDISCLINYIENNEYSFGVKVGSECENNVNSIMPPLPLVDYQSYAFQNVYPNSVELNRAKYFSPDSVSPVESPFYTIFIKPINSSTLSGGGYVLSYFNINFSSLSYYNDNSDYIEIAFTLNPTYYMPIQLASCPYSWNIEPALLHTIPLLEGGYCGLQTFLYYFNGGVFPWEPVIDILGEYYFHNSYASLVSLKYQNGIIIDKKINASFDLMPSIYFYPSNYYDFYVLYYLSYFWYSTSTTLIKKVYKSGSTTAQTDSNGNTKLTIKDALFTGPNYLTANFKQYDPVLNYVAANYQKSLSVGFVCDIEVNYRTTPICNIAQVPDRISRVEEFKVKMENYRPYEQPNHSSRDGVSYFQEENPLDVGIGGGDLPIDYVTPYTGMFNHIVYAPPDSNVDAEFIINKNGLIKQSYPSESFIYKMYSTQVTPCSFTPKWNSGNIGSIYGRYFAHNFEDERYRDSLFVSGDESMWETGNEITIPTLSSNSDLPTSWQPRYSGSVLRKYYCIFVKKIGDNSSQSAGSIQIRLANTYQDAMDKIHLPISNYSTNQILSARITLQVKYKYYMNDVTQFAAPYYSNFNPSNYQINNPTLQNSNTPYTTNFVFPLTIPFAVENMTIYPFSNSDMLAGFNFYNKDYRIPNTNVRPYFQSNFNLYSVAGGNINPSNQPFPGGISYFEFISLHPLKFIVRNVLFAFGGVYSNYAFTYNFDYTSLNKNGQSNWPKPNRVYYNQTAFGNYGFICDIIFEENIDEYHEHSLPQEFNAILTMDQYIQTSGVYNSKSPLKTINPEKCKHIGKVIDRKDCNCPKKWVRQCDLHETTDWKKCMGCPNFEPDED